MTDRPVEQGRWVPRYEDAGDAEAEDERAELIRGLYQLAAWVVDSPDIALPSVTAHVPAHGDDWRSQCTVVDRAGASLGVAPVSKLDGEFYLLDARFGPVEVKSVAIADEYLAAYRAHMSDWEERRRADRDGDAFGVGGEGR